MDEPFEDLQTLAGDPDPTSESAGRELGTERDAAQRAAYTLRRTMIEWVHETVAALARGTVEQEYRRTNELGADGVRQLREAIVQIDVEADVREGLDRLPIWLYEIDLPTDHQEQVGRYSYPGASLGVPAPIDRVVDAIFHDLRSVMRAAGYDALVPSREGSDSAGNPRPTGAFDTALRTYDRANSRFLRTVRKVRQGLEADSKSSAR